MLRRVETRRIVSDSLKLQLEQALANCKTTTPSSRGGIARDLTRITNEDLDMKTEIRKPKDANKTLLYTLSGIFF